MKKVVQIIATLTLIGIVSGGILSLINAWALPLIAKNQQQAATERAIFLVQPEAVRYELIERDDFLVYRVYGPQDKPLGYALVHSGDGYIGPIKLLIGLQEDLKTVTGIEVLDMTETPGLGTRINDEPFKGQFRGISADPMITWIRGAPPMTPNQVQVITGATISARAVVDIVNESIQKLLLLEGFQP